ncbi:hypothetical protein D3C76_1798070 [compost metagenome]
MGLVLLQVAGFVIRALAIVIKEPAIIEQNNLAAVALMEGAHNLVAEPFGQQGLLLRHSL